MDLVNAGRKGTFWKSKHYRYVKPNISQSGGHLKCEGARYCVTTELGDRATLVPLPNSIHQSFLSS